MVKGIFTSLIIILVVAYLAREIKAYVKVTSFKKKVENIQSSYNSNEISKTQAREKLKNLFK